MGDNLTFWQRLGLNLADHIPDTKFFKDRAYNIIASPKVGMQAGATKKDIFDLAFKTPDREDTNKYMFIYGADTRRPETSIGNAYDWQSDIDENNYTDVKSYEGILNPYNEYLIDSRNKGLIEELAKVGYTPTVNINDEYSDPNTHRLNPETPYFDDVHSYRPRFHMKDGKPVISASDLYDFGKNYTEGFQGIAEERSDSQINPYMLEFQRRALNSVGKPYRLVQKNIPIRFVDNPQGNEINRVNNFTNQVINNLSDEDIARITGTGYIEPAIVYYKKGGNIHIKKKNRGKFTEYCGGKVTEECIRKGKNSSNPAVRKRATFAANARKWKHKNGGQMIPNIIKFFNGGGISMFQNSGKLGSNPLYPRYGSHSYAKFAYERGDRNPEAIGAALPDRLNEDVNINGTSFSTITNDNGKSTTDFKSDYTLSYDDGTYNTIQIENSNNNGEVKSYQHSSFGMPNGDRYHIYNNNGSLSNYYEVNYVKALGMDKLPKPK